MKRVIFWIYFLVGLFAVGYASANLFDNGFIASRIESGGFVTLAVLYHILICTWVYKWAYKPTKQKGNGHGLQH